MSNSRKESVIWNLNLSLEFHFTGSGAHTPDDVKYRPLPAKVVNSNDQIDDHYYFYNSDDDHGLEDDKIFTSQAAFQDELDKKIHK